MNRLIYLVHSVEMHQWIYFWSLLVCLNADSFADFRPETTSLIRFFCAFIAYSSNQSSIPRIFTGTR